MFLLMSVTLRTAQCSQYYVYFCFFLVCVKFPMWHAASIYNFKETDSSPVNCQFCYVQYRSAFVQVGGMYKST